MNTDIARRPPRRWEIHTWVLLSLAAASALIGLLVLVTFMGLYRAVATEGRSGMSILVLSTLRHARQVDDLYLFLLFAYLVAFSWWLVRSRRLLAGAGHHNGVALSHWALGAWRIGLMVSVVIRFMAVGLTAFDVDGVALAPAAIRGTLAVYTTGLAVRFVALLFLTHGVWQIRGQIRHGVANPYVRPPRDPAAPPAFGPSPVARDVAEQAALPDADDEFWARVERLSATAGADLALLESTSALVRRWSLVPAAGSVAQLRASIAPGTAITVFPQPPQPGAAAPERLPAAGSRAEWFALIEDPGTGQLWFQLLLPTRVPGWLAQARQAHRWGLYRVDEPDALRAIMPQPAAALPAATQSVTQPVATQSVTTQPVATQSVTAQPSTTQPAA